MFHPVTIIENRTNGQEVAIGRNLALAVSFARCFLLVFALLLIFLILGFIFLLHPGSNTKPLSSGTTCRKPSRLSHGVLAS